MKELLERITALETLSGENKKLATDNRKLLVVAIVSNLPQLLNAISTFLGG